MMNNILIDCIVVLTEYVYCHGMYVMRPRANGGVRTETVQNSKLLVLLYRRKSNALAYQFWSHCYSNWTEPSIITSHHTDYFDHLLDNRRRRKEQSGCTALLLLFTTVSCAAVLLPLSILLSGSSFVDLLPLCRTADSWKNESKKDILLDERKAILTPIYVSPNSFPYSSYSGC